MWPADRDIEWGFGQILAVMMWFPVVQDTLLQSEVRYTSHSSRCVAHICDMQAQSVTLISITPTPAHTTNEQAAV